MSWSRYLKHDFFTARELNDVDRRLRLMQRRDHHRKRGTAAIEQRVDDLEDELGRMSLFVCVLLELGLAKRAFTVAELQDRLDELDRRDGKADGKLDPSWMTADADAEADAEEAPQQAAAPRPSKGVRKRRRRLR